MGLVIPNQILPRQHEDIVRLAGFRIIFLARKAMIPYIQYYRTIYI